MECENQFTSVLSQRLKSGKAVSECVEIKYSPQSNIAQKKHNYNDFGKIS